MNARIAIPLPKFVPAGAGALTETRTNLQYLTGFGNEFATEAVVGVLPQGQNSPQRVAHGLYAEVISGTPFTAPRAHNQRTWMYRLRPSAMHSAYTRIDNKLLRSAPFNQASASPNRMRWNPLPAPTSPTDFIDGLITMGGNGDMSAQVGFAIHQYVCNRSMGMRYFYNADGELLIVPQSGRIVIQSEMGILDVAPGEIAVVQRGIKFRVSVVGEAQDGTARGYVCENYGATLRLPELGPIGGSGGLANPRDFLTSVAAYEDFDTQVEIVAKYQGNLWQLKKIGSPLDVVAWHGNYAPYKYDLANFMAINTVSFDHPDPSINTVLTSPTNTAGTANVDFVIFPPRWMVAEHTFRPPWFHRNVMNEFMGLVTGQYDAKAAGFLPGGASLHNCMSAHGPDAATFDKATVATLEPHFLGNTLAFMFETAMPVLTTPFAEQTAALQATYDACWDGFTKAKIG
jgi:homogentisate 1,2-dioxygenase